MTNRQRLTPRYTLVAEHDAEYVDMIGDFASFEAAEARIVELENAEEHEGADFVLTDRETGKQWYFTDRWEEYVA